MTVEVRQLTIRAQLGAAAPSAGAQDAVPAQAHASAQLSPEQFNALRAQLLAECRRCLALQQRLRDER